MTESQYSSKDRLYAAIGSEEPDRVPVLTYSNHFQIRQAGYSYGEVTEDGDKFVEAQIAGLEEFGYDGVTGLGGPGMIAEALGAKLLVGEDQSPSMAEPGLSGGSDDVDLDELYSRDVIEGDHIPFTLEVNERLAEELGSGVPMVASISAPFREACLLGGVERLFEKVVRDPSFVKDIVDLVTEKVYDYAELVVEAGADILGLTDPFASSSMISRSRYRELIYPSEKRVIGRIHGNTGAKVLFHTCGEWGDRFDLAVEAGAGIYHVDGVGQLGLDEIRSRYPDVTIMGRVPTTSLLLNGSPGQVREGTVANVAAAGDGGNYVLAGNCSLAPETPSANVKAMVETAETRGNYPLNPAMDNMEEREVYFG
ncbi:uroporphyrinogen decarboxylase family protein [Candidatus Bipolaricaulota bacterium]|nr:uroporphyrinogen decarboxylase family protein [Candidatus Bipolaricaulota bacterium]